MSEPSGCRIITYGKEDAEFSIWSLGDIHWLNAGCSKDHLRRDVKRIKRDPYSLWFLGGDYLDLIMPGDKRFDASCVDDTIKLSDINKIAAVGCAGLYKELESLKPWCLGAVMGNHEHAYMLRQNTNTVHEQMCELLGTQNMGYSGWADLYFIYKQGLRGTTVEYSSTPPDKTAVKLRVFIHHGFSASATAGGKINALKRLADSVEADLVIMGHVHEAMSKTFVTLHPGENCDENSQRVKMGMISGSYLRAYAKSHTSYAEKRGYPPTTLGASRARFTPSELYLTVESVADNVGRVIVK
jgi:hypothetical protein